MKKEFTATAYIIDSQDDIERLKSDIDIFEETKEVIQHILQHVFSTS